MTAIAKKELFLSAPGLEGGDGTTERRAEAPAGSDARLDPLEELYRTHAAAVMQRLWRLCGDVDLARDLTQDTFVIAAKSIERSTADEVTRAWLHGIAYNLLRDHRRTRKRRRGLLVRWRASRAAKPSGPTSPVDSSLLARLRAALDTLDEDKRDAFVLRVLEGLSVQEAAEVQGVSPQTISYRTKLAEQRVRAWFEEKKS